MVELSIKAHEQSCSALDPVFHGLLTRLEIYRDDVRRAPHRASSLGIVVARARIDA